MTNVPPPDMGGNYFNLPRPELPIEALEDVNTILEVLHEIKSTVEAPNPSMEGLQQHFELLKTKSDDLSSQLHSLQNTYSAAFQYWNHTGNPPLSQELLKAASIPSTEKLQQTHLNTYTDLCGKMQTLHDLLIF